MKPRCPFAVLLPAFVLAVFCGDLVATRVFHMSSARGWVPFGLFVVLVATIETLAGRGVDCPYLEFGALARLALYMALFVITYVIIWPGVTLAPGVIPSFRWLLPVLSISVAAMLWIHVRIDHGSSEFGVVGRSVVVVSRLPLYFLLSTCAGVLILGVIGAIVGRHP